MAKFNAQIKSYEDAMQFLGGRDQRKLAHNTWVIAGPFGEIQVVYHRTAIATFRKDGTSEFTNGGHQTATTKQRLNELLPVGFGIYQKDFEWVLHRVERGPHGFSEMPCPTTLRLDSDSNVLVETVRS